MMNTAKALLALGLFGGGMKPPKSGPKQYPPHVPHQSTREMTRRQGQTLLPVAATLRTGPEPAEQNREFSRQVRREGERRMTAKAKARLAEQARRDRWQALQKRQKLREEAGFYDGQLPAATALAHKRAGRLHRRVLKDDTGKNKARNLVRLA